MSADTPAVIYAAKSTEDRHESIRGQKEACREMCEREGWTVVGTYEDEGFSAFSGNRGAGLAAAREHAARAARERGTVAMLVCRRSDRISRGAGDRPDASEALVEIWHASRRANVWLRSTNPRDDRDLETSTGAASIGERNRADSAIKSDAVRDGYGRARLAGKPLFGIVPDGYVLQRWYDADNEPQRRMVQDPDRRTLWELVWRLAGEGWSDSAIALELDRRGWRTAPRKRGHKSRPFDANRIRQAIATPAYAGLQVGRFHAEGCDPSRKPCCAHRTVIVGPGDWPAYVSPDDFYRLRDERRARASTTNRPPGRPVEGYLLAGVAVCGCGTAVDCVTSGHTRRDGTRARRYVCRSHREHHRESSAYCPVEPIDATIVDRAVAANLTSFLGDVDLWRDRVVTDRRAERDRMAREVERAAIALDEEERRVNRLAVEWERWLEEGNDAKADAVLDALTRRRTDRDRARTRLQAARDGQAASATDAAGEPTDALLDFFNGLRAELTGRVEGAAGDVKRLNACLRDYFQRVELTVTDDGIRVVPILSAAATERIFRAVLDPEDAAYALGSEPLRDDECRTGPDGCVATGREEIVPPVRSIAATAGNAPSPS